MIKDKLIYKILLTIVLTPILGFAIWCGLNIYDLTSRRTQIKKDYSELNNIQHGLLSVDTWRDNVSQIVSDQIENFDLSDMQEDTLKTELNKILNSVISKANTMVNKKQTKIGKKIKQFAIKQFVDVDKVRNKVPEFSQTIIDELKNPSSKKRLKFLAKDKFNEFAEKTHDSLSTQSDLARLLNKYNSDTVQSFNRKEVIIVGELQQQTYYYTYAIIGCLFLFLLLWLLLRKQTALHTPLFVMSVLVALVTLVVGLLAPMIEIDARIKELNFVFIGRPMIFNDQVIFYQSKSILDVVHILLATGKPDSIFVGALILIFSVLFPITKLISTKIYLLGNEKVRANKFLNFFAFKSGKWSMADVMVVAIFMAYIGFKGILDSQMDHLNVKTKNLATIATNETSLQPGVVLFVWYVIFGLILGAILKKITFKENLIDISKLRFIRRRKKEVLVDVASINNPNT